MKLWVTLLWLVCILPAPAQADEPRALGRLFNSPEERQILELERAAAEQSSRGRATMLNGMLKRSKGATTLWLNQEMQQGSPPGTPALHVGESLNGERRSDLLEPGAIRVIAPAR